MKPDDEKLIDDLLQEETMDVKIYLSTDGKHTVEVSNGGVEALGEAMKLYDMILAKYGTKQAQAADAYSKKSGFPDDKGNMAQKPTDGVPMCPDHHKPMTHGTYGWYCKTPVGKEGDKTLWCKAKPPVEFARE